MNTPPNDLSVLQESVHPPTPLTVLHHPVLDRTQVPLRYLDHLHLRPHNHYSKDSPRVKLPKLSLKKFNGDLTKWTTFWDTFESAVHGNPLTNIDKFNYLNSLLESAASDAISGLTLTSANYEEAIGVLKKRFGNRQLIVNRHMDLLLNLDAVTLQHDLRGLRKLYDVVESNVRGVRALGVQSSSYGGLLTPVLISKLPTKLRLIISRELKEGEWEFGTMMEILEREVAARERFMGALTQQARKTDTSARPPPQPYRWWLVLLTRSPVHTATNPTPRTCVQP